MKNILVLTDFSENAENAARNAVLFGGKLHANLLLFHNFQGMPVTPIFAGGGLVSDGLPAWLEEESKERLEALEKNLDAVKDQLDEDDRVPTIHSQSNEGNLVENIRFISLKKDIELIVMGSRAKDPLDHFFFGSETYSVIEHADCPVLIIPPGTTLAGLNRIMFATDFEQADMAAIKYLINVGKLFDCDLEIIHVQRPDEPKTGKSEKEMLFKEELWKLKYPKVTYLKISGDDVVKRLNNLYKKTGMGLLAMVHRHRSVFARILANSTTREILANQNIPIIVFPSR